MTTQSNEIRNLIALRDSINASLDTYTTLAADGTAKKSTVDQARQQLWKAATKLATETVAPQQQATLIAFQPWLNAVVRTALELDLFNHIGEATTASDLAQKTGADQVLIARLMRVLTGFNIVAESGVETYSHTAVSRALTTSTIADLNKHIFDSSWNCIGQMPAYLKSIGYQNPDQPDNTLSHFATGTNFFAYLRNDPARLVRFNSAMKGAGGILASPIPAYILNRAAANDGEGGVIMVDIGGGIGQVTEKTMETIPEAKQRFVVQDLGKIINEARAKQPKYEVMEYDFFTPQPVDGASLYFMRRVLHDFPDSKCREILLNQITAMTPGKSRLLICETILQATGCSGFESLADISRTTFCSMQRTERQWRALMESVGLTVVKVWKANEEVVGPFVIVESVVA